MVQGRVRWRFLPALAALALVLAGVGGCGGDEAADEAELRQEVRQAAQAEREVRLEARNARVVEEFEKRQSRDAATEEELEAGKAASRFYEVLAAERGGPNRTTFDSDTFCALMSERAVGETIRYARVASGLQQEWDCESAIEYLVIRSKRSGGFDSTRRAEVIGVEARGDRAVATVKFGDGPATAVPLVREDGQWKLAALPAAETPGGG